MVIEFAPWQLHMIALVSAAIPMSQFPRPGLLRDPGDTVAMLEHKVWRSPGRPMERAGRGNDAVPAQVQLLKSYLISRP